MNSTDTADSSKAGTPTADPTGRAARPLSTVNRAGLVVLGLLGVLDIVSLPTSDTSEPGVTGPPMGILILDALLGVVTVLAVVWAWRTARRTPIRLAIGSRVLSVVTALPAFFVDVPAALKALVAAFVLVTLAGVVASLWPSSERQA